MTGKIGKKCFKSVIYSKEYVELKFHFFDDGFFETE